MTVAEAEAAYAASPSPEAWEAVRRARDEQARVAFDRELAERAEEKRAADALRAEYDRLLAAADPRGAIADCAELYRTWKKAEAEANQARDTMFARGAAFDQASSAAHVFGIKHGLVPKNQVSRSMSWDDVERAAGYGPPASVVEAPVYPGPGTFDRRVQVGAPGRESGSVDVVVTVTREADHTSVAAVRCDLGRGEPEATRSYQLIAASEVPPPQNYRRVEYERIETVVNKFASEVL